MSEILVPPFHISYEGKDADKHFMKAHQLGESIAGASRLYANVAHYCLHGSVAEPKQKKQVVCYVRPPVEGSFEYLLFIAALAPHGNLLNEIFRGGVDFLVKNVASSIKKLWTKPSEVENVVSRLADVIEKQVSQGDNGLAMVLANGLIKAHSDQSALMGKLIDNLPLLAERTRPYAREMVSPVGDTCDSMTQFAHTDHAINIDESEAEVIRGGYEMEVDSMQEYRCRRITEVNVENGHCILEIGDSGRFVPGRISDPAIKLPNNIYTTALNNQTPITVIAKAIKKNGAVHQLHISDAKNG